MFVARRPLLWVLQWLMRLESALTSSLSPLQRFLVRISLQEIFVICLLDSIGTAVTSESLEISIKVHSSLSLECHRVAKKLWSISLTVLRWSERRSYTIREDSSLFFSVVTRWLRRRGQLLDDQWWQSIAEEAVRETFSQMEPNRAWSQNCSCLTSLDGYSFTVFFFYFNNFTNNRHICQNALWWVWAGVWVFGKPCKGNQKSQVKDGGS